MLKKIIALLLVLALCISVTPQAFAARIENSITLSPYAYTDNDYVYREFSNFGVVNISMEKGEWLITPAFHAIDRWVASYSGFSASSTNPDVAEAEIIHVGSRPVAGVANSFIGLQIYAKKPGTTEITVNYAAFVTNSQIRDGRGTPYYTKRFVVTVAEDTLNMDVSMNANEAVLDWPAGYRAAEEAYTKEMMGAAENLAGKMMTEGLKAVAVGGAVLMSLTALRTLGLVMMGPPGWALAAAGFLVTGAIGLAIQVAIDKNANREVTLDGVAQDFVDDAANEIMDNGLHAPMSDAVDLAKILYTMEAADRNNPERKYPIPTMTPQKVEVVVRLTNNTPYDVTNVSLDFSSESLSFTSEQGPWSDVYHRTVDVVRANESVPVTVPLYIKPAFHNTSSGVSQQIYTGSVAVQCNYQDKNGQSVVLSDAAELPVYTKLNEQDKVKAAQYLLQQEESRAISIMCPVDVHVLDKEGNTLAVLTTDGEPYQDETIMAGSSGDMKYLFVPQDKKDDYRLKIVAVDDGTMNIVGADCADAANMSVYADVPLKKGDTFFLDLNGSVPAELYAQETDGSHTPISPAVELNENSIAEALRQCDVSEKKRETVAHAMARALVPETAMGSSFQDVITLEQHAQLMLNLYEQQIDLYYGALTNMYLAENPDANPTSLPIAVAAWKGLLDREYASIALEKDAATRLLTGSEARMTLRNYCEIMELPESFFFEVEPLTLEQMICMVDTLWQASALADKDVELAAQLTEEIRSQLSATVCQDEGAVLYYREKETQRTALRNGMVYYPVSADILNKSGNLSALIHSYITLYTNQQANGTYLGNAADPKLQELEQLRINVGLIGRGNQTVDDEGWRYAWQPFYLQTQQSEFYQNIVYLFVCRVHHGADTTVFGALPEEENMDNRAECYVIADQRVVGEFLSMQHHLDQITNSSGNYPTIDSGSEEEAILILQQAMYKAGHLSAEPNGVYDEQTRQAVCEIQKALNLSVTGVADSNVQKFIYGWITYGDLIVEPWLAPYLEQGGQKLSAFLESQ